jgi:hypothetical protein
MTTVDDEHNPAAPEAAEMPGLLPFFPRQEREETFEVVFTTVRRPDRPRGSTA